MSRYDSFLYDMMFYTDPSIYINSNAMKTTSENVFNIKNRNNVNCLNYIISNTFPCRVMPYFRVLSCRIGMYVGVFLCEGHCRSSEDCFYG